MSTYKARVNVTISVEIETEADPLDTLPDLDDELVSEAVARALRSSKRHWNDVKLGSIEDPWYASLEEVEEAVADSEVRGWILTGVAG